MNNKEIKELSEGNTKIPHLPPLPNINNYHSEPYLKNPLLEWSITEAKCRQVQDLLRERAKEAKIETYRDSGIEEEFKWKRPRDYALQCLRKAAETVHPPPILPSWERKIRKMLPANLIKRFPIAMDDLVHEVRNDFDQCLLNMAVRRKLKPFHGEWRPVYVEKFYRKGKTDQYPVYLKRREELEETLFLTHPIIRHILNTAMLLIPPLIVDFSKYRKMGMLELSKLRYTLQSDIRKVENILAQKWYPKIAGLLNIKGSLDNIPQHYWIQFINCASNLMTVQVTELKRRTFMHVLNISKDDTQVPLIKMDLIYDDGVVLYPEPDDFYNTYHLVIEQIHTVGSHLTSLETWVDVPCKRMLIPTDISDKTVEHAYKIMAENALKLYKPVLDYVKTLEKDYEELYGFQLLNEINTFLEEPHEFEDSIALVDNFYGYLNDIQDMVVNVYFPVGRLCQFDMMKHLRGFLDDYLLRLGSDLISIHVKTNERIYRVFEEVAEKALKIPKSTEELIEMGQYMLWASTVLVEKLREMILESVKNLTNLMEIATLSEDHFELNSTTILWLQNIKPIFKQNSSLYEQHKYEFEEVLSQRTEMLNKELDDLSPRLVILNLMDEADNIVQYLNEIRKFLRKLEHFDNEVAWINREEGLFKFPLSTYPELDELKNIIHPFARLIHLIYKWQLTHKVWIDGSFEDLRYEFVKTYAEDYCRQMEDSQKMYRAKIKQQTEENNPRRFQGNVDDPDFINLPAPIKLCIKTLQQMKDFRPNIVLVKFLCNPALTQRHWVEISEIVGYDITPDAGTTLRKMLGLNLTEFLDQFEIVSIGANKELALRQSMAKMIAEWADVVFVTTFYKDSNISILSTFTDVQALLDDHIIKTLSMRGSVFVKPIEVQVREWYDKLLRIGQTVEEWGKVQVQWLYMLPIFSSEDIARQMTAESELFKCVDTCYQHLIGAVLTDPRVMTTAGVVGNLETLQECSKLLEKISEGVNNYLEKKRLFFARFFFLSNDEMLEILSETENPLRVQPHLKKCFEGISKLKFNDNMNILAMYSKEGEEIELVKEISTIEARGSVEKWLVKVDEQMVISIRYQMDASLGAYVTSPWKSWVIEWPGQVVLCVSQIYWAANIHKCLKSTKKDALYHCSKNIENQMRDAVDLVRNSLSKQLHITLRALVVLGMHVQNVVDGLNKNNVVIVTDFQWHAQLRYYWEDDNVLVRCTNATVHYAYEYLGNVSRLVVTPLTDRCYCTLICAYHLHLNGAPEGPAGTGKTETTKDLARALAVQCVVFNCSDGLDNVAMSKFFKGIASSGAWACFDDFNRINLEVLSVVAQQILSVIQAVQANTTTFVLDGTTLTLRPTCYVCITMNPGYAGRSELPDNLKVLFRSVAMMVPDYILIAEITLYSYGFVNARDLAVKMVTVYRLCSEQLSSQNHYDYGMRAVKTVLAAAGHLKLKYPNEKETALLLRSIIDVNLPKFKSHDVPLFQGIISDLFHKIELPTPNCENFLEAAQQVCKQMNLQPVESFLMKVKQIYEMMKVHHGVMLVGEPFGGKTSALRVLSGALTLMAEKGLGEQKVRYRIINPKAVTIGQLYGQFDSFSCEWTDGIASTIFRNYAYSETSDRKWVIFDGPVDVAWVENLNTVLDDNKKLCLPSGDVIPLASEMLMIFETMDLNQASPATVSRCGMVCMEPTSLGWQPLVDSWIACNNPVWMKGNTELFAKLFEWLFPPTLLFVKKHGIQLVTAGVANLVKATLLIIEMLLNDAVQNSDDHEFIRCWIQAAFVYAVVWGIAGILDVDSRETFDIFYKNIWQGTNEEHPIPQKLDKVDIPIPAKGLLHDHMYTFKEKGAWVYWPEILRNMEMEENINIQQTLVPTVDTARYQHVMDMHIRHQIPMLLIGQTGTGKSFYFHNMLMHKLSQEVYVPAFISFTTQTSANQTQELFISKLNKRRKGIYGPVQGKKCVIFIDNLNIPAKEIYGTQTPIELLRQYFDHGHWYDLKDTSELFLNDILIVAAMGLPGGSKQNIDIRFLRHFNIYSINLFSDESINKIYSTVLLIGLKRNGFGTDVMSSVTSIVAATLELYQGAISDLRPTPSKSHYIFNLRDFSRVIQGCSLIKKDSVDSKKVFIKLWVHEVLRVFYDRLIDNEDRLWFYNKLRFSVEEHFHEDFDISLDTLPNVKGKVTEESLKDLMFGNFMDSRAADEEKKYEEISSIESFHNIALLALEEYNNTHKIKMEIVLFRFALEHLSRICRVLVTPCSSALLVGVGGAGRQSLARLASAITGNHFFQPEITTTYDVLEWRDDLKKILKESGGQNKDTTFLFTEAQIKEEVFLEDIDSLLNSGEVPNIFAVDEKQEVLELVRLAAQGGNRNLDISAFEVFSYFVNRCKQKLHLILCFSPIGSSFHSRLRLYPSLVNCCTIDWFEVWPEDALEMVAETYMTDVNVSHKIKLAAVEACKYFHVTSRVLSDKYYSETGRNTYITSAAYLELIRSFTTLINTKQEELLEAKLRYVGGLDRLLFAAEQVCALQQELSALRPQLVIAAEKTSDMMTVIERETRQVEKASAQVKEDEAVANVQAAAAQELKNECEADLAQAIPILEDAIAALNTLKPTDITLVKSMKNPPDAIKLVMAAVCVMRDVKPDRLNDAATGKKIIDYWGPSKKVLGDMYFLTQLKEYDKDNIPPAIMKKIRTEYLPNKDFKPHIVAKASSAAEGLCKWVMAMDMYDAVAKEVAPKKAKLEIAEQEYNATVALLEEKRAQVRVLEEKIAELNRQLTDANERKVALEKEVDLLTNKLIRAEKLIGGLGGEKSRWSSAAEALQKAYDSLAGDILVSCGVIAYLAPFSTAYRNECIEDWRNYIVSLEVPCSEVFIFSKVLGTTLKIQDWNIAGLPRDSFSIDNAIIVDMSERWSLLVDPEGHANKWIKNMEKGAELQILKLSDPNYMKVLEHCVEFGKPALLENVSEKLDTSLEPLLSKHIFQQGDKCTISLGKKVVEYNSKFRFYITSKLRNPHFLPDVFNKVTLVNFALTIDGLEDQLLAIVVAKERPDLEIERQNLIIRSAENKAGLKQVEDNILITLSQTSGNILEDESAIEVLDSSKILSQEILEKQKGAKASHDQIDSFRLNYQPVARHSSVLYYCVTDLANIDPMYQYSLDWFINLYIISIDKCQSIKHTGERLNALHDSFTYNLYRNISRSLFEKDKLLFSFILCTNIMIYQKKLHRQELMFFLTGRTDTAYTMVNPVGDWLNDKSWNEVCQLTCLPTFEGFLNSFTNNLVEWKNYYDKIDPQIALVPEPWQSSLSRFQKVILIRVLRPDKVIASVSDFVAFEMGNKYVIPPTFDIECSYEDSDCLCPLIFILSPGADPMTALTKFALHMGFGTKFQSISLGQGQGPVAEAMIKHAQLDGAWVCLQNCHLAIPWMPSLEKIWENFDRSNTSANFRLWLTSYPTEHFPVSILQFGVKMTNEPPSGLQQNLLCLYLSEPLKNPAFYNACSDKEKEFTRLLFALCFFHSIVQERKKFGPIGWNVPYEFNESDFHISIKQLQLFINESEEVPYSAIAYLTGECNYGGRVVDDWDRRTLTTILESFISSQVVTNPDYLFFRTGNKYGIPEKTKYTDCVHHIENLLAISSPEVFGFHTNAGIMRDLRESKMFIRTMMLVHGEAISEGGQCSEQHLYGTASTILAKLPKLFDLEAVSNKYPVMYEESMNAVLVQELQRFNKLLNIMHTSLETLQKAVKGIIIMSLPLEELAVSLQSDEVPKSWSKISYPSLKSLGSYVTDVVERVAFLQTWCDNGKPPTFWLSGFFFTLAFLTGATQNFARKHVIPINLLTYDFEVLDMDQTDNAPADGVYIYGLYVDGARWDREKMVLAEQYPKILQEKMPLIWIKPVLTEKLEELARYKCPLYKTSERRGILSTTGHSTNYVLPFLLESDKPVDHWIKRGVALLCQLDD